MLAYDAEDNVLRSSITGTAENAYGTPDNIYSVVLFTIKGEMKMNKRHARYPLVLTASTRKGPYGVLFVCPPGLTLAV